PKNPFMSPDDPVIGQSSHPSLISTCGVVQLVEMTCILSVQTTRQMTWLPTADYFVRPISCLNPLVRGLNPPEATNTLNKLQTSRTSCGPGALMPWASASSLPRSLVLHYSIQGQDQTADNARWPEPTLAAGPQPRQSAVAGLWRDISATLRPTALLPALFLS